MDIKQELIDKLREAIEEDSSESEITLTVEQIDSLIDTVNDNISKDGIIKDLQAKLKEKDDIIAKLYVGEPLNIYLGIIKNFPRYPDCTHEWLEALNSFLSIEFPNVKVLAPFIDLTKDDVFKIGCRLGVKLEDTFSCNFSDNGEPCGVCENCKWRAAHMYPSYFLKEGNEIGK